MSEQLLTNSPPILSNERFIEGRPETTKEIIQLTEGIQELQTINPEIVGASLFGSALKGKATEKSDYDTNVFVDANQLAQMGISVTVDKNNNAGLADNALKGEYSQYIGDYLGKKLGKDPAQLEGGIFIVPISNELIDYQLDQYFQAAKAKEDYRQAWDKWYDNDMEGQRPEEPEFPTLGRNIGTLFSAELTTGLEEYRQRVLDRLQQAGSAGEEAWDDIMLHVKFGEGHMDDKYYPPTVDEAVNKYGVQKAA